MERIDARRIHAQVIDLKSFGYRSDPKNVSKQMGNSRITFRRPILTISRDVSTSIPFPAVVLILREIDLSNKPLNHFVRERMLREWGE